jgi:hypothetical protein
MADYTNWIIGGLIPVCVLNNPKIDPKSRTITINCFAARELMNDADPEDEIQRFQDIAAYKINNNELNNAGSNLKVASGNPIIAVTDGTRVWNRCAIQKIATQYGEFYRLSGIYFTLVIEYEVQIGGGFTVLEPPYHQYDNVEYYQWTDKTNPTNPAHIAAGNELGYLKATFDRPIKKVIVYGTACLLPAWINVQGAREGNQNWVYGHEGREEQVWSGTGVQPITFNLDEPTTDIIITTSSHLDRPEDQYNHGCWLMWIKFEYA